MHRAFVTNNLTHSSDQVYLETEETEAFSSVHWEMDLRTSSDPARVGRLQNYHKFFIRNFSYTQNRKNEMIKNVFIQIITVTTAKHLIGSTINRLCYSYKYPDFPHFLYICE